MIEAHSTHPYASRHHSKDDSRVASLFQMRDVNDVHWKALERITVGRMPSKVNIQRLLEIRCVAITALGEVRITGLGHDALNRYRHRL